MCRSCDSSVISSPCWCRSACFVELSELFVEQCCIMRRAGAELCLTAQAKEQEAGYSTKAKRSSLLVLYIPLQLPSPS